MIVTPELVATMAMIALDNDVEKATVATAISFAENASHDLQALGDLSIQDAKWGPSAGLWQIRTLKAERGTGADRDLDLILSDTTGIIQASIMARISRNGTVWQPWSVYTQPPYPYRAQMAAAADAVENKVTHRAGLGDVPAIVAGSAANAVGLGGVANFVALLMSWATWQRVLTIAAGAVLFVAGVAFLAVDLRTQVTAAAVGALT